MARRTLLALLCAFALTAPGIVRADEGNPSDTCSNPCPDGQVTTSFLDGEAVTCVCMAPGPGMTDDSATNYGGSEDPGAGSTPS
jgi:hypothetical protein